MNREVREVKRAARELQQDINKRVGEALAARLGGGRAFFETLMSPRGYTGGVVLTEAEASALAEELERARGERSRDFRGEVVHGHKPVPGAVL
jgi:hypothetical protein